MLKFENLANVGDRIRAYDFYGNKEAYIEGVIVEKGAIYRGMLDGDEIVKVYHCDGYTINIDKDSLEGRREGDMGYVPFEVSMLEYDDRIEVIA